MLKLIQEAAAVEREACRLIAQTLGDQLRRSGLHNEASRCDEIAARIKARGNP